MGRDVAALVVGVEGVVESEDLDEGLVVVADAVGEVVAQVLLLVEGGGLDAVAVDVVEDPGGDGENLGAQIEGVLQGGLPVVSLGHAGLVALGEVGVLAGGGGRGQSKSVMFPTDSVMLSKALQHT